MKTEVAALFLLALVGCSDSPTVEQERRQIAQKVDEQAVLKPQLVVTLPDGREVYRIKITNTPASCDSGCGANGQPHFVYFVGETLTVNRVVSSGKSTRNEVEVIVNGKKMEPDEARKYLDDMSLREAQEREQLQYLQTKYGSAK